MPSKSHRVFKSQILVIMGRGYCLVGVESQFQIDGHIEVAHVRTGTNGGMGLKPGDFWTISLCRDCHSEQHRIGERSFEAKHGIDMKELARAFVKASPKRADLERARDG